MPRIPVAWVVATMVATAFTGCTNADGQSLNPNEVERFEAPAARSSELTIKVNRYRDQTFAAAGDGRTSRVVHSDVLYTASYRHAAWLNTANSADYSLNSAFGEEGEVFLPDMEYADLNIEERVTGTTTTGTTPIFPVFFTAPTLYGRVSRVVGGREFLTGLTARDLLETYAISGDVPREESGSGTSAFRGFDPSTGLDAIDSLWYSRIGRLALMRADTRYIGFATPTDGGIQPPYPILEGRFAGVMTTAGSGTRVNRLGIWPNNGNTDVVPYGLDTGSELGGVGTDENDEENQAVQYSGPPIHVTLPTADPILYNQNDAQPTLVVKFKKMEVDPVTTLPQQSPGRFLRKTYNVTLAIESELSFFFVPALDNEDPAFSYTPTSTTMTFVPPYAMRGNELFIVPTEPLEPNSWYEVGVRLQSASYVLQDTTDPTNNPVKLYTWQFKTNNKAAPAFRD